MEPFFLAGLPAAGLLHVVSGASAFAESAFLFVLLPSGVTTGARPRSPLAVPTATPTRASAATVGTAAGLLVRMSHRIAKRYRQSVSCPGFAGAGGSEQVRLRP